MVTNNRKNRISAANNLITDRYNDMVKEYAEDGYESIIEEIAILRKGLAHAIESIRKLGGSYDFEEFINYNNYIILFTLCQAKAARKV